MKKINYRIELFVERYNGAIQLLLLSFVILFNCIIISDFDTKNTISLFEIIISLLIGIILELIILQIKDSSSQRKMNSMGEVVRRFGKEEDSWKSETDLMPFFDATKEDFFISGIIIDKLVIKYLYKIDELLRRGIRVKILIESFDEIEEAAKFLYGQDYNKNSSLKLICSRLTNTLIYLQSLDNIESYFLNGLLEIGLSTAPFINPSIIAYDYEPGNIFEAKRSELGTAPEMSVRFYMQGVDGPTSVLKTHPTLLVNSNIMAKQYDDFVKVIENMWNSSIHIKTKEEFDNLKDNVTKQAFGMEAYE